MLQTGKGRAIAVSLDKRMRKLPDVPTFKEQGIISDAFRLKGWICAVGPTGMPEELVNRYSNLFVEAGKSEKVQQILDTFGIDESAIGRDGIPEAFQGGGADLAEAGVESRPDAGVRHKSVVSIALGAASITLAAQIFAGHAGLECFSSVANCT